MTNPIIAIALVLVAVFVPLAFISGLSGQFYKQFALTIAISTVISAINSLTLSPALAALLFKGHEGEEERSSALQPALWRRVERLQPQRRRRARPQDADDGVYVALLAVTGVLFKAVPDGFVPQQDKQYLIGFAQLPDGATLDRTEDVMRRMGEIMMKQRASRTRSASRPFDQRLHQQLELGIVFAALKNFDEAQGPGTQWRSDRRGAQQAVRRDPGRLHRHLPAAAGAGSRHDGRVQAVSGGPRVARLRGARQATKAFLAKAYQAPELAGLFSTYQVNVPQLYADIDRTRRASSACR